MIDNRNPIEKVLNVNNFEINGEKLIGPSKYENIIRNTHKEYEDKITEIDSKMKEQVQIINAIEDLKTHEANITKQMKKIMSFEPCYNIDVLNTNDVTVEITGNIQTQNIYIDEIQSNQTPNIQFNVNQTKLQNYNDKIIISNIIKFDALILEPSITKKDNSIIESFESILENDNHNISNTQCYMDYIEHGTDHIQFKIYINEYMLQSNLILKNDLSKDTIQFNTEDIECPISSIRIKLSEEKTKNQNITTIINTTNTEIKDVSLKNKYNINQKGIDYSLYSEIKYKDDLLIEQINYNSNDNIIFTIFNGHYYASDPIECHNTQEYILYSIDKKEKIIINNDNPYENHKQNIEKISKTLCTEIAMQEVENIVELKTKITEAKEEMEVTIIGNNLHIQYKENHDHTYNFRIQNIEKIISKNSIYKYTDQKNGYIKYQGMQIPLTDNNKIDIYQDNGTITIYPKQNSSDIQNIIIKIKTDSAYIYEVLENFFKKCNEFASFIKKNTEYDVEKHQLADTAFLSKNNKTKMLMNNYKKILIQKFNIKDIPMNYTKQSIVYRNNTVEEYIKNNPTLEDFKINITKNISQFNNRTELDKEINRIKEKIAKNRDTENKLDKEKIEKYKKNVIEMANVMRNIRIKNQEIELCKNMLNNSKNKKS